ncbi:MAG: DUF423 domain-containing protein [Caulobacteraceae bacterium]|nr:DUF423 domain-containing protein [Caulobacteraceae bacterium]
MKATTDNGRIWLALAALSGLAAVGFGAFGAHGVADPTARDWLATGAHYQLVHALAAITAVMLQGQGRRTRGAAPAFVIGAAVFAGTLYAMALGGPRILGAVTPVGGLAMMLGWLLLAVGALRR